MHAHSSGLDRETDIETGEEGETGAAAAVAMAGIARICVKKSSGGRPSTQQTRVMSLC